MAAAALPVMRLRLANNVIILSAAKTSQNNAAGAAGVPRSVRDEMLVALSRLKHRWGGQ